ncbi:antitoxin VbhA family protein [Hymenobacter sp. B81]|uniref:antitoxin VbhA family protein n=1 Tax=Hymenobacter sp. B81 TaxID=3344878 RepID=UPI0037DD2300
MESKYFKDLPPGLSEAEGAARRKRQQHAEWGIAVAAMGGTTPSEAALTELQRYIDGELSLEELARLGHPPRPETRVFEATANRERITQMA